MTTNADNPESANLANKTIAIVGYGSQGRAQALNLRDSGCQVVVGLRPNSPNVPDAEKEGLRVAKISEAVDMADLIMVLLPDEAQPSVFAECIAPHLSPSAYLGFAHGLAVHFHKIVPPTTANVFLVAPRGPGRLIRRYYVDRSRMVCSIGVFQDTSGDTRDVALAYAAAIGAAPDGVFDTTFAEECQADLFGEQAVLCGGLVELIRTAYETLVEDGFSPQMAYFECLHEVKLIADLLYERGIAGMRSSISNTARYGGLTRGLRIIGPETKEAMKQILQEIRSGQFAEQWIAEYEAGMPNLTKMQQEEAHHPMEETGAELRHRVFGEQD